MILRRTNAARSEPQRKRMFLRRMEVVHGILLVSLLIIIARLIELQIIRGGEYEEAARAQHYGGIVLPAKRGEILSRNSKTGETNILATNTTLDLLYVDPFVTEDKRAVARLLAEELLTGEFDRSCRNGGQECPRELRGYYESAFDPLRNVEPGRSETKEEGHSLFPVPRPVSGGGPPGIPDIGDIRSRFAADIEQRIGEEFVSFVPLLYGATKVQIQRVQELGIPGIETLPAEKVIYGNPIGIPDFERHRIARILSPVLGVDAEFIRERLRRRRLRYVPVMRRIPPDLSKRVKKLREEYALKAVEERQSFLQRGNKEAADAVQSLLRGVALIPEHWRMYPDATVASQVVGFLSMNQQAQGGIERTFDHELKGQEGRISALTDPFGGQIVSDEQTVVQAQDGKSVILTIDRYLQKQVETILERTVREYEADSAQAIVMDPFTGRIIVMANAPLLDGNNYSAVYGKVPANIAEDVEPSIVVEIYHPELNELVIRGYLNDFTPEGRDRLSRELQAKLHALEQLYDLDDLKRYYLYVGENSRIELFPVRSAKCRTAPGLRLPGQAGGADLTGNAIPHTCWLKYGNRIGVGAYINRTVQEIYEPGSVFKPVTMAIAIDQGEVTPEDTYNDEGIVEVDEYRIKNAEGRIFGEVTMTDCLSYSVNTCLTSVSRKLGKKLFESYIRRFGFGRITGVQLEDEKSGDVLDWRRWSDALLATAAYGQGISATPLQMTTAYAALANGGKLMKPTVIDTWMDPDGTEKETHPQILEQVVTEEAAATVTAMLVRGMNEGFAKRAKVPGYRMAGKTGTSQIAGPGGKYEETGSGTTIASLAGYAPVDRPRFVLFVKFDRPRTDVYGTRTAAPVFREIAKILFEYYGIPPDET